MKINITIFAALLFFLPMTSLANGTRAAYENNEENKPTHFILCLNSGEQITFLLDHCPKVVNEEQCIVVIDDGLSFEYPVEDVHKYMMGNDSYTDISNNKKVSGTIKDAAGQIILSGFKAQSPVMITGINGTVVYKSETDTGGFLSIDTYQYTSGVYVVSVQNKTFKFIKR